MNEKCQEHSAIMRTRYMREMEAHHSALDEIASLKRTIEKLEKSEKPAVGALDNVSRGHIQILETTLSKVQSDLEFSNRELTTQKKLNEEVTSELKAQEQMVSETSEEVKRLQQQIQSLKQENEEKANAKLQSVQQELTETKNSLGQSNIAVISISRERDELQERLIEYHKLIKEKDERFVEIEADRDTLSVQHTTLANDNKKSEAELNKLKTVVTNYRLQISSLADLKKKLTKTEEEKFNTSKLMRKLKDDLKVARKTIKQHDDEKTQLFDSYKARQAGLEKELDNIKNEYDKMTLHLQNELIYSDRLRDELKEAQAALTKQLKVKKLPQNANFGKYMKIKSENQRLAEQLKEYEENKSKKNVMVRPTYSSSEITKNLKPRRPSQELTTTLPAAVQSKNQRD